MAAGVYLGILADERLTREPLQYRVLVDGDGEHLAQQLHREGWPAARQLAVGPDGLAAVILVVVDAEEARRLDRDLDRLAPHGYRTRSRLHGTRRALVPGA